MLLNCRYCLLQGITVKNHDNLITYSRSCSGSIRVLGSILTRLLGSILVPIVVVAIRFRVIGSNLVFRTKLSSARIVIACSSCSCGAAIGLVPFVIILPEKNDSEKDGVKENESESNNPSEDDSDGG